MEVKDKIKLKLLRKILELQDNIILDCWYFAEVNADEIKNKIIKLQKEKR